ncbi:hypothetical protein [Magnetospirillum sp. UT-4]|uniref:hypothetical protein n=1 Tax=Magnetospirillum sp. UT-4 TaxID=2681467 RepID=UPI00137F655B|nr:hypothetical protein [Magnetospirillum sp. UT-4]CAA7613649.1 conserved hypothetical protein [Magnetospirillum sp. UT-4]
MFAKFLLTVAVVALIWFGFKFAQRIAADRRRSEDRKARAVPPPPRFEPATGADVQELVRCPVCNVYRSGRQASCGRSDCPY